MMANLFDSHSLAWLTFHIGLTCLRNWCTIWYVLVHILRRCKTKNAGPVHVVSVMCIRLLSQSLQFHLVGRGLQCSRQHVYSVSRKSNPPPHKKNLSRHLHLCWNCATENYRGYCPNIFLCLHQFWFIYLNICMNCIIFTSKTPQIITVQFRLLRNSWIFR